MATRELRASGPLGADAAWERYAQPALWHTWSPQILRVTTSASRIAPGVRGLVWSFAPLPVIFRVVDVDERGRTWSWRVTFGLVRLRLEHGVEPTPDGCATWLRVHGPAAALYAPLAGVALGRLVRP